MDLIFIGQDGSETSIGDIPALVGFVRAGAVIKSTLVKNRGEASWQPAERHPDIAALFSLREAQEVPSEPRAGGAVDQSTHRVDAADLGVASPGSKPPKRFWAKAMFLALVFFVGLVAAMALEAADNASQKLVPGGQRIFLVQLLFIFMWPATLAVRDRRFTFGGKAWRFVLSVPLGVAVAIAYEALMVPLFLARLSSPVWEFVASGLALLITEWVLICWAVSLLWRYPRPLTSLKPEDVERLAIDGERWAGEEAAAHKVTDW